MGGGAKTTTKGVDATGSSRQVRTSNAGATSSPRANASGNNLSPRQDVKCWVEGCEEIIPGTEVKRSHRLKVCANHQRIQSVTINGRVPKRWCQQCTRFHDLGKFDGPYRSCRARLKKLSNRRKGKILAYNKETAVAGSRAGELCDAAGSPSQQRQRGPAVGADHQDYVDQLQGSALGQLRNEREQASPMRAQTDSKPSLSAVNDSDGAGSIDHQMPQAELPLTPLHPSKVSCRGSSTSRASSEPSGTAVGASTRHSGSPNLLPSGDGGRAGPQVAAGPSSLQRHSLRETEAPPPSAQRFPPELGLGNQMALAAPNAEQLRRMGRILGCGSDDCAACAAGLPFACTYLTHDEDHQQPARPQLIANIADTGIPYTDPPGRTWIPQHMQPSASGLDVEDNNSQHVLNMRMKIHNATPGELPPGLHDSLLQITGAPSDSIRGWIRPGCVDLSVDFWFNDTASYDRALMSLEQAILNPEVAMEGMPWRKHETDVQLPTMSAIVSPGGTVELIRRDTAGPAIDRVLQPATAGYNVTLMVSNLPRSSWKVLCRRAGGVFQTLEVLAVDEDLPHGQHFVDVGLPEEPGSGLAWLEIAVDAEGSNQLSPAVPLLISDFWEVAEEVSRYVRSGAIPCTSAKASLFKDIAHVLSPERAEGSLLVEVACRVISCAALNDMPALLEEAGSKAYGKGILQSVLRRLDDGGIGLLGLAVLSGNCRAVREALSLHRLCDQLAWAIRPCGPHGLTALHWAAFKGLSDVIALVKEEVPQAAAAWETARAAQEGCTLMELFKLYSSHQALLPEPPGNIPSGSGRVSDTGSSSYVCEHGNPPFDGGALHLLPVSAAERAMALLKAKRLKMMAPLRVCLMLPTGIGM